MRAKLLQHFKDNNFPKESVSELMTAFDSYVEQGSSEEEALAQLKAKYFGKPVQQEAKASRPDYRGALEASLSAKKSGLSKEAISRIMKSFAEMEAKSGSVNAFEVCLSHWGNQLPSQALEAYGAQLNVSFSTPTSREIESDLSRINGENKILTNPADRLRRAVSSVHSNFARLLKGLNCELTSQFTNGKRLLCFDQQDYEKVMGTIPKLQSEKMAEYAAFGSWKKTNTITELEFEE